MGLALVHSRARAGVRAPAVRVEVYLGGGLPSMSIVGLPEAAVREAKDRVRAAIQCAQFEFPARRACSWPRTSARSGTCVAQGAGASAAGSARRPSCVPTSARRWVSAA